MNLHTVVEEAARAGLRFELSPEGLRYTAKRHPSPELLAALRRHRGELLRRVRDDRCCWCESDPRPAWFVDHDSNLPICRLCLEPVGQARLDVEGFDRDQWEHDAWRETWRPRSEPDVTVEEVEATGWKPENFACEETTGE
jgi:hypothetical protein